MMVPGIQQLDNPRTCEAITAVRAETGVDTVQAAQFAPSPVWRSTGAADEHTHTPAGYLQLMALRCFVH
jgi:hypothetical protein